MMPPALTIRVEVTSQRTCHKLVKNLDHIEEQIHILDQATRRQGPETFGSKLSLD